VRGNSWVGAVVRFVRIGYSAHGNGYGATGVQCIRFVNALIAAIVIAALGWAVEALLGDKVSPQSRGIVGVCSRRVVIYVAQYLVPGMTVTIWGALLASLVVA
jgi:putative membrane protein